MRDIYIVSIPRGARVQVGPNDPRRLPPSAWRKLTRAQVRKLIADRVNGGCISGAKVWIETRRETARIAGIYGFRPVTLARDSTRARRR